jgi:hypothetical protein
VSAKEWERDAAEVRLGSHDREAHCSTAAGRSDDPTAERELLRAAIENVRAQHGDRHPFLADLVANLGGSYLENGENDEGRA